MMIVPRTTFSTSNPDHHVLGHDDSNTQYNVVSLATCFP